MNKQLIVFRNKKWIRSFYLMIFLSVLIGTTSCGLPILQSENSELTPVIPTKAIPTLFIPTPDCGIPTLVIGSKTFQIQPIQISPDGSLTIPADSIDIAYWVNETNTNYVFGLSPTQENLSLISALPPGSTATATWTNCNSTSYTLFGIEQNPVGISVLLNQSTEGITIFIPSDPSTASHILRGELTGEEISSFNTPSGTDIQAEISLLETTASPDGATIRVSVSIQNYGGTSISLTVNDVTLSPEGTLQAPLKSDPSLPAMIGVGAAETFQFTFPRPASPTAILNILGTEYDIEGY